ncbi:MAG: hypothetical protein SYC29_01490, partial [Planctomycetota bacterium]|nr:hypothetical protein [Planctomycetota bacterium]
RGWTQRTTVSPSLFRTARELGRNLDLSAWFNRPSLIVIGYLRESACPIPLRVAGRTVNSEGLTVVRWVHPLPLIEPIAFPEPEEEEGSAQAQSDEPPAGATP